MPDTTWSERKTAFIFFNCARRCDLMNTFFSGFDCDDWDLFVSMFGSLATLMILIALMLLIDLLVCELTRIITF
jgi:hypothetical protein